MGDSSKVEKVIPSITDSSQFDPWGIKSLCEEGVERGFDYVSAQSLINVYERQRGRTVPVKIEFLQAHPLPPVNR